MRRVFRKVWLSVLLKLASEAELMLKFGYTLGGTHTKDGEMRFSLLKPPNAADMSESVH